MDNDKYSLILKYSYFSLKTAKEKIKHRIWINDFFKVHPLLHIFGSRLSQEEKDNFLISCVTFNRPQIVPVLLALGANPNMIYKCTSYADAYDGSRPLHFAAERGNVQEVKTLLEFGAIANVTDRNGETPLMKAARAKAIFWGPGVHQYIDCYENIIEELLVYELDATLVNRALQIAETNITSQIIRETIVNCLTRTCKKIR